MKKGQDTKKPSHVQGPKGSVICDLFARLSGVVRETTFGIVVLIAKYVLNVRRMLQDHLRVV